MEDYRIREEDVLRFAQDLKESEYARGSIEKYVRDIRALKRWLGDGSVGKEALIQWKEHLLSKNCQSRTVNGMLSSLNRFFRSMGWEDLQIKHLKVQRTLFRSTRRELTKSEYLHLIETAAGQGKHRLALLMETICATGIRVSEVKYITAEAVREGRTDIHMKGKIRTILIPGRLCRKLQRYAKEQRIFSGELFRTRTGKGVTRRQIWAEMKGLCAEAGVAPSKVFPHNLRHLFARTFYRVHKDVAQLADVLGHSSIETTRIYLISTGAEHARKLERLRLIS
ncbi:tyrosine-type recombinase/integrase [uncultured Oscillibacter sp.]|uniref:tyrosine-type recombinase/integrase n=1 Tax=uncultured Oscillibacter sp. TaxID=876091 RepID=UPI0025FA5AE3|nr:tyrosine-type recombinase/integrase [uncultured Oscillibacter sp.]